MVERDELSLNRTNNEPIPANRSGQSEIQRLVIIITDYESTSHETLVKRFLRNKGNE